MVPERGPVHRAVPHGRRFCSIVERGSKEKNETVFVWTEPAADQAAIGPEYSRHLVLSTPGELSFLSERRAYGDHGCSSSFRYPAKMESIWL